MKEMEMVETSSPPINGNLERTGRSELASDRKLHAQSDREGPDERAHV
jgi:hypothetical protein